MPDFNLPSEAGKASDMKCQDRSRTYIAGFLAGPILATAVTLTPLAVHAQAVEGVYLGQDRSVLERWAPAKNASTSAGYTTVTVWPRSGVSLEVTYSASNGTIVALEAKAAEASSKAGANFGDFKFGRTSLRDIRSEFGTSGVLYPNVCPATATSSGAVEILNYYDVQGTDFVAKFVTTVGSSELAQLNTKYGNLLYANMPSYALLSGVGIYQREYLEKTQGSPSVRDAGYEPIKWVQGELAPSNLPTISLDRIKPSQLPVFRIYNGPNNYPDFSGRDQRFSNFRIRIADGMTDGPKFAGEYSVIQFGCGTGCSVAYLGNNRTGEVFDVPVGGEDNMYLNLKFQLDSRLLVAQWADNDPGKCFVDFFSFDDGAWTELMRREVGAADACFKSVAENLR
ncbi:hypothetical protein LPB79_32175 (plasmid) [Rhizobium sp. T136]|uniref:hypothetical protein n=1 Tax=Rhizobium sp. T136 TaxID=555319 RepID=UPI001E651F58|nr:hypothetical protein [Rhizobium sp. T136]UFS85071.1 hypothetical protein LPB79_32175 [Rhizobium sp. T136]